MTVKPVIGITVGDPAGIGPEIVTQAAMHGSVQAVCHPLLVGSLPNLRHTAAVMGSGVEFVDYASDGIVAGKLAVVDVPGIEPDHPYGELSAQAGQSSYDYIVAGVQLAKEKTISSLVTAPINKAALQLAGQGHLGHTELLAELTESPWSLTYFTVDDLRVLFLTRHLSLKEALETVDQSLIVRTLERFCSVSSVIGLPAPRIALQAMNPHGGDGGLFGNEEQTVLLPAVEEARSTGINVMGPVPADSVFALAREGRYDVVLALYHDIAAAVCKSIDFHGTVSTTLGLPFLRFSVDHGTAFDIAGKGIASSENMRATLLRAAKFGAER